MRVTPIKKILAGISLLSISMLICFCNLTLISPPPKTRETAENVISLNLPDNIGDFPSPHSAPLTNSSDPQGDEWPMFHGQLNHTGTTQTNPLTSTNYLWYYPTPSGSSASPVVTNDSVFITDSTSILFCINSSTGQLIWQNTTLTFTTITSIVVASGKVFVGSADSYIYCLNASTGGHLWKYLAGGVIHSSPAIANGSVFFGCDDGNLYSLNASTGQKLWNYATGAAIYSSPAITNESVFFGSEDKNLYCLNATTGGKFWNYTVNGAVTSSPAVANERVFFGSIDTWVYCLNASTGGFNWKYKTDYAIRSSPAIADGRVYTASDWFNVYCLDATNGAFIWRYDTQGYIYSSVAVANGSVFIGSGDKKVYAINATSGTTQWTYTTANNIFYSSPAIANGSIFIASLSAGIYRLPMRLIPTAPQNLRSVWGNGQVKLTWQAPTSGTYAPITNYLIYRGTTPGSETYLATAGNVSSYIDNSITAGQNYYYKVNATCGAWEGLPSNEADTPVLTVTSPTAYQLYGNSTPSFTTSVIEPQLSEAWYRVGPTGNNHTFIPGTPTTVDSADWTAQANGTVLLYFWANDTQGNLGFTNITIRRDCVGPPVTITTPGSGQVFNATAPHFELSITEVNLDKIWYNLQGSGQNTTCLSTGDFSAQWVGRSNGTVVVTFWANDTLGNLGTASVTICKDIDPPVISITNPGSGQVFNATAPQFVLSITEGNPDQIWYNIQGSGQNTTCLSSGDFSAQWVGRGNGTVVVTFWANDTAGNLGTASVTIYKDIDTPVISITNPGSGQVFNASAPQFVLVITDGNLDKIWYNLQGSGQNSTCLSTGDFSAQWGGRENGSVVVTFWANDTLGNLGTANVTINKDIAPPIISITNPISNQLTGPTPPQYSLSISEGNMDKIWYSLDGNVTNTTCTLSGDFFAQWGGLGNGTVVVTFWVNDSVGNMGTATVTIRKNINAPTVIIQTPLPYFLYGSSAPAFSLLITPNGGSTLTGIWYSLDLGNTNTSCSVTGDFSAQWQGRSNGSVQALFWANDSVGNTGLTTITLQKDILAPIITIISPSDNFQSNSTPPTIIFTAVDANIDKIWYTLGGDPTKYFLTTFSFEIDPTVWKALPAGKVAIIIHANDTLGNETPASVLIIKQDQGIQGLMLIIIIILVALTIALITIPNIRKKQKVTTRRFISTNLTTTPAITSTGQSGNLPPADKDHGAKMSVVNLPVSIPSLISLNETGEDESESSVLGENGVFTYRGGRIVGSRFIYKVKVKNTTDSTITDIGIQLVSYPRDCMRLVTDEIRHVSKIEPNGFRSLEFELQPQKDCVEGSLISSVNYLDSHNELHTIHVKPFVLKSVCDLMEPLVITEAVFEGLVKKWSTTQEIVTFKDEDVTTLVSDVPAILKSKNFHPISHQVQDTGGILTSLTRGIATGKYTKRRLAFTIRIVANVKVGDGSITCQGFAEDESMLVACLSELLAEFRKPLVRQVRHSLKEHKGISRLEDLRSELQVELPTLADAIRQEKDFVFLHGGEQVATVNYIVDFLNDMRKDYVTIPVSDLEAELRPAGKTMYAILQELIASGKLRATWIGTSEIRFKAELHKIALKAIYYLVAFLSGLATIIIFLKGLIGL